MKEITVAELRDLIADLTAALDNVLLHQGSAMTAADYSNRSGLVLRAEQMLEVLDA